MEIKKIDTNLEKLIITSLIVSDKFIKSLIPIIDISLLKLNYSRLIANWCIDFFKKYKTAPHKNIKSIYENWKKENSDEELHKLIELFLEHISSNYEREENYNEDYCIDQAIKYLKQRKLKKLNQQIDELRTAGKEDEAEKLISEYKKIQLPIQDHIDVFNNVKVIEDVLNWEEEELFSFSGAFGKVIGNLTRGDLVAFAAPAKRGKSFFLIEAAIQAALKGLRVIFFSLEMTRNQVLKRIYQNILGETKKEKEIDIPEFSLSSNNKYEIINLKMKKEGLESKKIKNKINGMKALLKGGKFKLFCSSPNAISVSDICNIADNLLENEGFVADVIVVDFADIVKSEYKSDHRHKINNKWEELRACALSRYCLLLTATHTNKLTFDRDMKQGDMSEDIRKINHVSLMLGINQKKDEKKRNIARIAVLANRDDEFHIVDEIVILQCLNIAKPILDSKLASQIEEYSKNG